MYFEVSGRGRKECYSGAELINTGTLGRNSGSDVLAWKLGVVLTVLSWLTEPSPPCGATQGTAEASGILLCNVVNWPRRLWKAAVLECCYHMAQVHSLSDYVPNVIQKAQPSLSPLRTVQCP